MFRDLLSAIKGQIHISFDLWTSGNSLALLGIVLHHSDGVIGIQTVVCALPRIQGAHSGENMAVAACEAISFYRITARLGFFTLDNASTNDTAVKTIPKTLRPNSDVPWTRWRLQCVGHVINLVAKALLYGKASKDDKDEAEDFAVESSSRTLKLQRLRMESSP